MRTICSILLLFGLPATAATQGVPPLERATLPAASLPDLSAPPAWAATESRGHLDRFLRAAGGAAVGAWVGYLASQVAVGDWDDDAGMHRESWAAGGAALGFTFSFTLPDQPQRAASRAAARVEQRPGREVLSVEEIRDAQGGTVYEIIRSLRPEWLRTRGTASIRESARGSASGLDDFDINVQPGILSIRVYLDGSLLGGVDELRTLDPGLVTEARFLTPAQATQRWGAGHLHGAIQVLSIPKH